MEINRRTLLKQGLMLLGSHAATTLSFGALAANRPFFERSDLAIGLQLYTVWEAVNQDLEGTLMKVASIGFREIELVGLHGHPPSELRAAAQRAGLRIPSIHVGIKENSYVPGLSGDIPSLADKVHAVGATFVILPMPLLQIEEGKLLPMSLDDCKRTAAFLNEKGLALRREGLHLGYHNHNTEFVPIEDTTGYDVIVRETDPELVTLEMDAGWVRAAGVEPVELLERYPGRFKLMHIKDLRGSTKTNHQLTMDSTDVGRGIIDWQRLLPDANAAGVQHYFVEQEKPFANGKFAAITNSFRFLSSMR